MLSHQLGEENNIVFLQERGFLMPNSGGAIFPSGYTPSELNPSIMDYAVLFEVAISSAVSCSQDKISSGLRVETEKSGIYDAIRIESLNNDEFSSHPFEDNLILFKNEQLLPMYVAEISYQQNTKGVILDASIFVIH